tara:strand:+ start:136 stop:444 length:309 start_codon:yes stop_codon:yes gene_type:complete
MRVKLQYTVDVKQVPKELEWMFDRLQEDMQHVKDLYDCLDPSSMDKVVQNIESLRTAMFNADTKLQDIYGIVTGYLAYISQGGDPPQQEQKLLTEEENVEER